jgi:orotate phosphoribosyltransferase
MASATNLAPAVERERPNSRATRVVDETKERLRRELFLIVKSRSFKTGSFKLSSGKESNLYFNMKPTMMHPKGAELVARLFLDVIHELEVDYISGLEMGAVPAIGSVAAISSFEGNPIRATFVRKRAKEHGTKDVIEGLGPDESLAGANVLVLDDVATSGKSILQAIEEVRKAGGIVDHAACIVNREEGSDDLLAEHRVTLHSIFHASEFLGD